MSTNNENNTIRLLKIATIIQGTTSLLSVIGSTILLISLCRTQQKAWYQRVYSRLLFWICIFDLILSISYGLGPIAVPQQLSPIIPGASGNIATCTAQGFFRQLGGASLNYMVILMFYYVLVIRYNWKQHRIARTWYCEPLWHTVAWTVPLFSAIYGVVLEVFNPIGFSGCWTASFPPGCNGDNCIRGKDATTFLRRFNNIPSLAALILLIVLVLIVAITVIQQQRKTERIILNNAHHHHAAATSAYSSSIQTTTPTTTMMMMRSSSIEQQQQQQKRQSQQHDPQQQTSQYQSTIVQTSATAAISSSSSTTTRQSSSVIERQTKEVKIQCLLYGVSSINCILWINVTSIVRQTTGGTLMIWSYYLTVIFFPLQGAFNCIIFLRPRYLDRKSKYNETTWQAIQNAIWNPSKATTTTSSSRSSSNHRHQRSKSGSKCSTTTRNDNKNVNNNDGNNSETTGIGTPSSNNNNNNNTNDGTIAMTFDGTTTTTAGNDKVKTTTTLEREKNVP